MMTVSESFSGSGSADASADSAVASITGGAMDVSAGAGPVPTDEASRQLEQAIHDARVAFDCIALGELDRAHTHAITARAAVDAALTILQVAISVGAEGG
jgi:hypothetical protein